MTSGVALFDDSDLKLPPDFESVKSHDFVTVRGHANWDNEIALIVQVLGISGIRWPSHQMHITLSDCSGVTVIAVPVQAGTCVKEIVLNISLGLHPSL